MRSRVRNNWKLHGNKTEKERFYHARTTCLERLMIIINLRVDYLLLR